MVKIAHLDDAFSEFLTGSKPSRRSIIAAKRKKRGKRKGEKKKLKNRKPHRCRSLSCLKILILTHAKAKMW